MSSTLHPNEWVNTEHALKYLGRAGSVPHREEGEAVLLEFIPKEVKRILDLGTGDGRLLALLRSERPNAKGVAVDVSPAMLRAARQRFRGDANVQVLEHDLEERLPDLGLFDAIVSSFAIHHVSDKRKKALYSEVHAALCPGGVFCNLEHVAPLSVALHRRFLEALGTTEAEEDPSNQLVRAETQLDWLREIGFRDVDCHWKWLELALLAGVKST
ncbi:MAG: class I SAM-dependent methyltransferase [Bryobacterales bacterium]|nr:class I SAM-dependent methyltransferase [Bryobacterales bacterium]